MYQRITQKVWPEHCDTSEKTVALAKRVKSYTEGLIKKYNVMAARLRVTGGGVDDPSKDQVTGDTNLASEPQFEELEFYVSADGPNEDTTERACNLWDELTQEWPFFPRFHKMMAYRPNVVPICLVTGVTPSGGPNALLIQPLDDTGSQTARSGATAQAGGPVELDLNHIDTEGKQTSGALSPAAGGGNNMVDWDRFLEAMESANPGSSAAIAKQLQLEVSPSQPLPRATLHQILGQQPQTPLQMTPQAPSGSSKSSSSVQPSMPTETLKRGSARGPKESTFQGSKKRKRTMATGGLENMLSKHIGRGMRLNYLREQRQQDMEAERLLLENYREGLITSEEFKAERSELRQHAREREAVQYKKGKHAAITHDNDSGDDSDTSMFDE